MSERLEDSAKETIEKLMEKVLGEPSFLKNRKALPDEEQFFAKIVTSLPRVRTYSVTFNPANVAANTASRQTVTVTGVKTTDILNVNPPTMTAGLNLVGWRVSATDTVELVFLNSTGSGIDEASGTYLMHTTGK